MLEAELAARPLDAGDDRLGIHHGVGSLLRGVREAGADEQVTALAGRAVAHVSLDNPAGVAELLDSFRQEGADEQVTVLLARDPAAHVSLDDPADVGGMFGAASLLRSVQEAGAGE